MVAPLILLVWKIMEHNTALRLFEKMKQHGCAPNINTYNALISGICREELLFYIHIFIFLNIIRTQLTILYYNDFIKVERKQKQYTYTGFSAIYFCYIINEQITFYKKIIVIYPSIFFKIK